MKFLRDHSKKIMAVLGVFLMLAFVIPSTFRGGANDVSVVGKLGDEKVTRDEVAIAEDGWRVIASMVQFRRPPQQQGQSEQWLPLVASLPITNTVYEQLRQSPTMYYLLQAEAHQLGLLPSTEDARQVLNSEQVAVQQPDGARIEWATIKDENQKNNVLFHVANFLMVENSFRRAADAAKLSRPLLQTETLSKFQTLKSYVVDFPIDGFKPAVAAPTTQQLQTQFDQFGNEEPGNLAASNPLGFGYKFPNRVKVQYILVPLTECTVAVRQSKNDYDWEVDAAKYYDKNASQFPTTQPGSTSSAISQFVATAPSSQASTMPTTRPFGEVKTQIVESLITPAAAKLQRQIVSEISSRMDADFAKGSAGTLGTFDYLKALAADVTAKHKVTPTIVAINDSFKSAADLRLLPNIGRVPAFPDFATNAADPFLPEDQRGKPGALAINQPAKPLTDGVGNTYVYQITAADPAHKPASMDEVKDRLATDFIKAQAFAAAKTQAQALLTAAQQSGLKAAAEVAGQKVTLIGPYSRMPNVPISDYALSIRSQAEFVSKTFGQLGQLNQPGSKPVAMLELPAENKIAVAEVVAVDSALPPESLEMFSTMVGSQLQQQYLQLMAADWFLYDSIAARLKFTDTSGHAKPSAPAAADTSRM